MNLHACCEPRDHLPASLRDSDCRRRDDEKDRRRAMYMQAKAAGNALRTIVRRQPGPLTKADADVLAEMIRRNLGACVLRRRLYCPTRARLARDTGYDVRTVSRALTKLKAAGVIVAARYASGGRLGHRGRGLATEFRSGCLQFLAEQLAGLGYRLPKSLRDDLAGLARWAAHQVGESTEPAPDSSRPEEPTGTKCPSTFVCSLDRASPETQDGDDPPDSPAPAPGCWPGIAEKREGHAAAVRPNPSATRVIYPSHCTADGNHGHIAMGRRPIRAGSLASIALAHALAVPMPRPLGGVGVRGGALPFALCGGCRHETGHRSHAFSRLSARS